MTLRYRPNPFVVSVLLLLILASVAFPETLLELSGRWSFRTQFLFAPERSGWGATANYWPKAYFPLLKDYLITDAILQRLEFISTDMAELTFTTGRNSTTPLKALFEWNKFPDDFGNILTLYPKGKNEISIYFQEIETGKTYLVSYSNEALNKVTMKLEKVLFVALMIKEDQ